MKIEREYQLFWINIHKSIHLWTIYIFEKYFYSIEMCFVDLLLNNFNNWYKKYYISYRIVLNFSQGLHKPNLTSSLGSDTLYWNPVLWKTFFTIQKRDHLFDCFVCWYLLPVWQWHGWDNLAPWRQNLDLVTLLSITIASLNKTGTAYELFALTMTFNV